MRYRITELAELLPQGGSISERFTPEGDRTWIVWCHYLQGDAPREATCNTLNEVDIVIRQWRAEYDAHVSRYIRTQVREVMDLARPVELTIQHRIVRRYFLDAEKTKTIEQIVIETTNPTTEKPIARHCIGWAEARTVAAALREEHGEEYALRLEEAGADEELRGAALDSRGEP